MNAARSVLALIALGLCTASATTEEAKSPLVSLHTSHDRLLRAHVKDGAVDYAGLKKEEEVLDGYQRTRLTPFMRGLFSKWLQWSG